MSQSSLHAARIAHNDEDVLGVFGRLKSNIQEIKLANSLRNSTERVMYSSEEALQARSRQRSSAGSTHEPVPDSNSREKPSRQSSVKSDRPSHLMLNSNSDHGVKQPTSQVVNGSRREDRDRDSTRHHDESQSQRTHQRAQGNASRTSTKARENEVSRSKKSNPSESESGHSRRDGHSYGSLKRDHSKRSNDGRDSRASERSHRSTRSQALTDNYLEQYHKDWMMHWTMQQQMNQSGAMYGYAGMSQLYSPMGNAVPWPQGIQRVGSVSSLAGMAYQQAPVSAPVTPMTTRESSKLPTHQSMGSFVPETASTPTWFANSVARPGSAMGARKVDSASDGRIRRPEWRGCLLSPTKSADLSRTGRSTTIMIKVDPSRIIEKYRTEMEMFPGVMLWDSPELRDKIVDFCRHMSSLTRETEESFSSEMEAVFWDLVVHLVSRGENSRPYEVAQILSRLLEDSGTRSISSVRSEVTSRGRDRDRYSEASLGIIRRCLLAGDVESAILHAETGDCWDLALCLQTVSSNIECKNHQANDLAMKCLDVKIQRGDPVHTICSLACGKMPHVEACFKDWVSNLAVVLACSGFIGQEDLRLRFITALSDLLHTVGMPMARDICTMFGNPERRFRMQPFMLIGSNDDEFSMSQFFMTEVFVYLAQILQGVNLHVNGDLLKVELMYVQQLMDSLLTKQAVEYCRNIVVVVKDYDVHMGFEMYAHLLEIFGACGSVSQQVVEEEWFQWLWNIFIVYKTRHHQTAKVSHERTAHLTSAVDYKGDEMRLPSNEQIQFTVLPSEEDIRSLDRDPLITSRIGSSSLEVEPPPQFCTYPSNNSRRASEASTGLSSLSSPYADNTPQDPVMPQFQSEMRSSRANSISIPSQAVKSVDDTMTSSEDAAVPLFSISNAASSRPSFFTPFPTAVVPPQSTGFVQLASDPGLNTGNAPYFTNNQGFNSETEDEKGNKSPKFSDPTKMYDDPDTISSAPFSKKGESSKKSENVLQKSQGPGWFESFFKRFKRKGQVHLPDDSKPKLIYDKDKKQWVNIAKPEGEDAAPLLPPPKMVFPEPDTQQSSNMHGGPVIPGSVPPPGGNMFRIGFGQANSGYNPYATIMAGMQAQPLKPVELTNHFIPSPTIPEE